MRIVRWSVTIVVAILLVIFAVSNRQPVDVIFFWPLSVTITSPLSLVVLGAVVIAFLVGQFVAWLGAQRGRQETRAKQRRIEALERELAATQAQIRPADEFPRAGKIDHQGAKAPRTT